MFEVVSAIKFSFKATINLSFISPSTYILKVFKTRFQCLSALLINENVEKNSIFILQNFYKTYLVFQQQTTPQSH